MPKDSDWFPSSEGAQVTKVQNIRDKIATYKGALGLSDTDITEIETLCDTFLIAVIDRNQADAFSQAVTIWKNTIKNGPGEGAAAAVPTFTGTALPAGATIGVVPQIRKWRDKWMDADGFTEAIGEDLMLFATEADKIADTDIVAEMKASANGGYQVLFVFSKQGLDALRIEWRYAGTTNAWGHVDTYNSSPAVAQIEAQTPGQPVAVEFRCRLLRKNQPVGQYSPTYTVYVTP